MPERVTDVNVQFCKSLPYIVRSWDGSRVTEYEETAAWETLSPVGKTMTSGTYYVPNDVTINGRIEISGRVDLIIPDGVTLTAKKGIHLNHGNQLYIYGQTNGTGKLTANSEGGKAAIGGDSKENMGELIIHGTDIMATGNGGDYFISYVSTSIAFTTIRYTVDEGRGSGGTLNYFGGVISAKSGDNNTPAVGGAQGAAGNGSISFMYDAKVTAG